jgi:hypothetical protein
VNTAVGAQLKSEDEMAVGGVSGGGGAARASSAGRSSGASKASSASKASNKSAGTKNASKTANTKSTTAASKTAETSDAKKAETRAQQTIKADATTQSENRQAAAQGDKNARNQIEANRVSDAQKQTVEVKKGIEGSLGGNVGADGTKTQHGYFKAEVSKNDGGASGKAEVVASRQTSADGNTKVETGKAEGKFDVTANKLGAQGKLTAFEANHDYGDGSARVTAGSVKAGYSLDTTKGPHVKAGVGLTAAEVEVKHGKLDPASANDVQVGGYGAVGPKLAGEFGVTDVDKDGVPEYRAGLKVPLGPFSVGGSVALEGRTLGEALGNGASKAWDTIRGWF